MLRKTLLLMVVSIYSLMLLSAAGASNRGLTVVPIKDAQGNEIGLYKESHALVIGVSGYSAGWPKLPGVKNDVAEVKNVLEWQGFNVEVVMDPTRDKLVKAYEEFINRYGMHPENRLLFYFAGHGHTLKQSYGEEMGYIVPVDAPNPNKDQQQFLSKSVDMQQIEVFAKRIQSKHALFLFDSCFSGSLFAITRAVPESISYKTAKPVRQFITSGAADEQVPDTSIFRQQFVSVLNGETDLGRNGYITGTALGEYLQDSVVNYSKGSQHPQFGKIRNPNLDKGDFVFTLAKAQPSTFGRLADIQLKEAPKNTFTMDEYEKRAQQIELNKAGWNKTLNNMRTAYNKVIAYQERDLSPDLKAGAWNSFLSSFPDKNPYSDEDEKMRQRARHEAAKWEAEQHALTVAVSVGMMSVDAFAAETGEAIFKAKCASCHPDGGNIIKSKKSIKGIKDAKIVTKKIRAGGGGMPTFDAKAISDADAKSVANYIVKTFKK